MTDTESYSVSHGREDKFMWQTMFDITELKGKIKYTIEKNVKELSKQNYKNYLDERNLKEKWNVYKYSICCDKGEVEKYQFLAVVTDAKLVQDNDRGGIFEYSWKEVEIWSKDHIQETEEGDPELITLIDEENSPDAPIQVVEVTNGLSGTYREDPPEEEENPIIEWTNPAFNINELFNSDEGDDIFVGPGINVADEDFNDYPEGYQVMPVGGYFRIEDPKPCDFTEETGREDRADVYYHNHLVQMYRMPGKILETIKPLPRFEEVENEETGEIITEEYIDIPEEIFFFDVQNAHDGLCGC